MKPTEESLSHELERRILQGLACEWAAARGGLDAAIRFRLRSPLFRLADLRSAWGYWSGSRKEICLSRKLVLNHPWDAVKDVLLHEMAHQLAEQVLNAPSHHPHGPVFRKACLLLRADPRASGTYPLLWDRVRSATDDRMTIRIRKLMALAQSANRFEAEAAMMKAQALITKYNRHALNASTQRTFYSVFAGKPAVRQTRDAYHLAALIQECYFVQGIWVPAFVLEKGKTGRVLEISGTSQNLAMAGYVFDFVQRCIASLWHDYNRDKGLSRHRRTDFAVGIIEGFRQKLRTPQRSDPPAQKGRALVPLTDGQLLDYVAFRHPHTTRFRRAAGGQDPGVLGDGMEIGKGLVIHKGVSEKRGGEKRLLSAP